MRQRKRQGNFVQGKFVLVYFFVIGPWKYCFFSCQEQKTIKSQQRFGQAFFFLLPMQRGSAKNEIASKRKQAKPCSAGCFLIEEARLSWLAGLAGMAGMVGLAGWAGCWLLVVLACIGLYFVCRLLVFRLYTDTSIFEKPSKLIQNVTKINPNGTKIHPKSTPN